MYPTLLTTSGAAVSEKSWMPVAIAGQETAIKSSKLKNDPRLNVTTFLLLFLEILIFQSRPFARRWYGTRFSYQYFPAKESLGVPAGGIALHPPQPHQRTEGAFFEPTPIALRLERPDDIVDFDFAHVQF
jgi:hypothetical protein